MVGRQGAGGYMSPSPAFLAAGRRMNKSLMTDAATAYVRGEPVDDGEGGSTYPVSEVEFVCGVLHTESLSQAEAELFAEQLKDPGTVVIRYPLDVDLPLTAEVDLTRGATSETARYEVAGLIPVSSHPMMRRAILKLKPAEEGDDS